MVALPPHTTSSSGPAAQAGLLYALPHSLPGFDIAAALKRLGGNERLLADLLQAFATEHGASASDIDGLLRERRPAAAAAALHRVKGAARIVGAHAVATAAQALEDDVRHGRAADIGVFANALSDAVDNIGQHVAAAPAGTGNAYKL